MGQVAYKGLALTKKSPCGAPGRKQPGCRSFLRIHNFGCRVSDLAGGGIIWLPWPLFKRLVSLDAAYERYPRERVVALQLRDSDGSSAFERRRHCPGPCGGP